MKHFLVSLCLLGTFLHAFTQRAVSVSEFQLEGDYLIGGLFDIHYDNMQNFPSIFKLISINGSVQPWAQTQKPLPKVISVVGPFASTRSKTIAPLFMADLVPMIGYAAASSVFSNKAKYPSFMRTVPSNKSMIDVIVKILLNFKWRWVAFINSDDDYGTDGLNLFIKRIKDSEICLAYTQALSDNTDYSQMFKQIEAQKIRVIIVVAQKINGEAIIKSAIQLNITNKVWIAGHSWASDEELPKIQGIKNIGTILGVSIPVVKIPGFSDFIYSSKVQTHCENAKQDIFCNQKCNCSLINPEKILAADPSFSLTVYSAIYAIAHALHNTLQCGAGKCNNNITVYPHMVLTELKKSNFTLLNQNIQFDDNGEIKCGYFSIVFWNNSGDAQEVGFYKFNTTVNFFIDNSKINWYTNGEVPTSLCSPECPVGYIRKPNGIQICCFTCEICAKGTYVNITGKLSCNGRLLSCISAISQKLETSCFRAVLKNMLYRGKYMQPLSALAVLSSLYSFLLWYFLPKCYIIIFQPHKNTQQYFQGLIQNYTKTISQ
uniref:Uncharacterized protein n=1 Tax=Amphilophus citrinellus TaxID=61819 RepID=A0A3Q0T980_AMPCI